MNSYISYIHTNKLLLLTNKNHTIYLNNFFNCKKKLLFYLNMNIPKVLNSISSLVYYLFSFQTSYLTIFINKVHSTPNELTT